jgi:hypothetical protein
VNASSNAESLVRIRPRANWANVFGLVCPAINAAIICLPDTRKMSLATTDNLI